MRLPPSSVRENAGLFGPLADGSSTATASPETGAEPRQAELQDRETVRVAVVQPGAVFFDVQRSVEEASHWIGRAAETGAKLILLPEAYVGGYPWGLRFGTAVAL